MNEFMDLSDLLALGIDPDNARQLLGESALTGHGGRPIIETAMLPELLAMIEREWGECS